MAPEVIEHASGYEQPYCRAVNCEYLVDTLYWLGHKIYVIIPSCIKETCVFFYEKIKEVLSAFQLGVSAMSATVQAICSFGPISVRELASDADQRVYQARVCALEKKADYPLGPNERFKIDHGLDYFAFFKRLGLMHYFVAQDEERVVGVAAGVLRTIPFKEGQESQKTWYLCDLKIDPDYRGRHIPIYMFMRAAYNALTCFRGYAISMNPANGQNRIVKMFKNYSWAPISQPKVLHIFSMNVQEMKKHEALLKEHRGEISYLSLQGKKDLVLQSSGKPLPLLHAQFGPCKDINPTHQVPQEGYTHMFCVPESDPLFTAFAAQKVEPAATASIISSGMEATDWKFILTSDI